MDLDKDPGVPGRVPEKADRVEGRRFLLHVRHPVAQGCVHLKDPLIWTRPGQNEQIVSISLIKNNSFPPGPLCNLLALNVLETALVEANPDCGTQPLLSVVARQVPQLLDLYLVRLRKDVNRAFLR